MFWGGVFCIPSRGYQELCQVHFCRTMSVDISDTTVPNLIYVLKMKCYLADDFYLLLSSSQELSFKCWENLVIAPADC
jgi:hypothetical protein